MYDSINRKMYLFKESLNKFNLFVLICAVILAKSDLHSIKSMLKSIPLYMIVMYGFVWISLCLLVVLFKRYEQDKNLINDLVRILKVYNSRFNVLFNLLGCGWLDVIYLFGLLIFHFSMLHTSIFVLYTLVFVGIRYVIKLMIDCTGKIVYY